MLLLDPHKPRIFHLPGLRKDAAEHLTQTLVGESNTAQKLRTASASELATEHRHRDSLRLIVDSGPGCGTVFTLPRGDSLIGRGPGRIQINDPAMSREHALIRVTATGITISELDGELSVNGERTDSAAITDADTVLAGDTTLRLVVGTQRRRGTALLPHRLDVSVQAPPKFPWLGLVMAIAPLGIGIALWLALGSWFMLVFGALGVLTGSFMVGQNIAERRRYRRRLRQHGIQHIETLKHNAPTPARIIASWHQTLGRQTSGKTANAPAESTPDRWGKFGATPHGTDSVSLRIGTVRECRLPLTANGEPTSIKMSRGIGREPHECPAVLHLQPGESVRIVGPPARCLGILRAVLVSFMERGIPAGWTLRIPASSRLPARLLGVSAVRLDDAIRPHECLLVPPTPGAEPITVRVESRNARTHDQGAGPDEWIITCSEDTQQTLSATLAHDGSKQVFQPDSISFEALDHASVLFKAATDPQQGAESLPDASLPAAAPAKAEPRHSAATVLGTRCDGAPLAVDIVKDGPHALIAGTTGSGKSELLRAWVLGLTERYSPEHLRLALVDFKGGTTFSEFASLPHVETCVTDLDGSEVFRIVEALRIEMTRREKLLNGAGVSDVSELPQAPPRLIVMIDEFRILAQDHPSILTDIMRLATLGRALGLHLILATQRPQGIVTPEIKANISLTVCLRLVDTADSMSLIGSTAAAEIPAAEPGRVIIASTGSPLIHGMVEPTSDAPTTVHIGVRGPRVCDEASREVSSDGVPTLAERLERIIAQAPQGLSDVIIPAALPEMLSPHDLDGLYRLDDASDRCGNSPALGLITTPEMRIENFAPRASYSIGICGGEGNEDAAVIRGLAHALSGQDEGRSARSVIVLDGLGTLESTKHIWGCYVGPHETSLATEVLRELKNGRYPHAGGKAGHGGKASVGGYTGGQKTTPPTLWIISPSSWWADASDRAATYREQTVRELALKGTVGVIINGGRDLATSRTFSTLAHRIYLPYAVAEEARHVWPRFRPVPSIPGRGVLCSTATPPQGLAVQLPTANNEPRRDANPHRWGENCTTPNIASTTQSATSHRSQRSTAALTPELRVSLVPTQTATAIPATPAGLVIGADALARNELINQWCAGYTIKRINPERDDAPEASEDKTIWVVDNAEALTPTVITRCERRIAEGQPIIFGASTPTRLAYLMPWWRSTALSNSTVVIPPVAPSDFEPLNWRPPLTSTTQPHHVLVNINQETYRAVPLL